MQRRLVLTMVGLTLATVVLVGAGILTLAQVGSRQSARQAVASQLTALTPTLERGPGSVRGENSLIRLRSAFDLNQLEIVAVRPDGSISAVTQRGPSQLGLELEGRELSRLQDGDTVLIDDRNRVIGLKALDLEQPRPDPEVTMALLVGRKSSQVGQEPVIWFLLSAGAALLASVVLASWLAGRFIRPIRSIEEVTNSIASGDLTARVDLVGDDELSQLGRSVNRMAADLDRSRAAEQEFLLSVSHDLRTPLTSIGGYAEALADGATEDPNRAGEIIGSNASRLNRLVDDLLDLARLSSRQFTLDMFELDASEIVEDTVRSHAPQAEDYDLSLSMNLIDGAPVVADPDRLAQAVGNLIDNAVKYADARIIVAVRRVDGWVEISVNDDGPGIPTDDLPHVFERLYVTNSRPKRKENASGLGLAIVRELSHAMGGDVGATSTTAGTTMTILLPQA